MHSVNFYLKKAEKTTGHSLIYLQFKYQGRKLVFSFGQTVLPSNWNKGKQRVKSNLQTTADGQHSLNELLNTLEKECKKAYYENLKSGVPQPSVIKQHLYKIVYPDGKNILQRQTLYSLIQRFTANEIHHKGASKKQSTITKYKTVEKHLRAFEKENKYRVDFDTITLDFYYKYVAYLREKGQSQNTIAKNIQVLKTFMNEAVDLGYTKNVQFRHRKFSAEWEDTDAVYLTEQEILQLYKYDFTGNKKLEQVRDLFVFGCFVGLRFSDYSSVEPQNIKHNEGLTYLDIRTKKTGERVIIPCHPVVLQIFKKYSDNSNQLPKAPSNQKFNEYIKDACKEAKLNEIGRLQAESEKELWQCVTSHTARRSFATNLYLQGFPVIEIMKITGHRTEKAFLNYIKVSKLEAAKRLAEHVKKSWNIRALKEAG